MACGVALKRSLDFDPLHNSSPSVSCQETISTPASKRRRYSLTQRCGSVTQVTSTSPSVSSAVWRRYTSSANNTSTSETHSPFTTASKNYSLSSEQIVKHIYQEYKRMKKRRQLLLPNVPSSSNSRMFSDQASSSSATGNHLPSISLDPKSNTTVVLPGKQSVDLPLLSMKQVGLICERLLKEQEERLRTEYEKTLVNKLSEQYDAFVKFSQDQLRQQLQGRPASYVS